MIPDKLKDPKVISAAILAAVASVAPFTAHFEGERNRVYADPIGIPTYCDGETKNPDPSHIYSHGECQALLRRRLARDYAPQMVACVPEFADPKRHLAFTASLDASYNAGPVAFCRSAMAKAFRAGQWQSGCHRFVGWYVTAGGRRFSGLVNRRLAERDFCLTGKMPK